MMHSSDLKRLLIEYGKLSIGQLHILTKEDKEDLQFLIKQWIQKGRIKEVTEELSGCGGGCGGCNISSTCEPPIYYSWISQN